MERILILGRKFLGSFTAVFTCMILASTVFIGIYSNPYLPFHLIVQSLIIAVVSALLNFVYYTEQPIRKRSMVVRTIVHFTVLLLIVSLCAWRFAWFSLSHTASLVTFLLLFLGVYALIWAANFVGDLLDERRINKRLAELRESRAANEARK